MAKIDLATVEYGTNTENGDATVLITFAVDTGDMPGPVAQDFTVEILGVATGDIAQDVDAAQATLHQTLRALVAATEAWA